MRRQFARRLPHAFHRHELGRIGRQAAELDAIAIPAQPALAVVVEPVTGPIVDDEEDLAPAVRYTSWRKNSKNVAPLNTDANRNVKFGRVERDRAEHVSSFRQPRSGRRLLIRL